MGDILSHDLLAKVGSLSSLVTQDKILLRDWSLRYTRIMRNSALRLEIKLNVWILILLHKSDSRVPVHITSLYVCGIVIWNPLLESDRLHGEMADNFECRKLDVIKVLKRFTIYFYHRYCPRRNHYLGVKSRSWLCEVHRPTVAIIIKFKSPLKKCSFY